MFQKLQNSQTRHLWANINRSATLEERTPSERQEWCHYQLASEQS